MKLPELATKIRIHKFYPAFPPLGYIDIEEGNDGAGNSYGMYWELGKEMNEPIICFYEHEDSRLIPTVQNLELFLHDLEGHVFYGGQIDLKDSTFFLNTYNKSRILAKHGKNEEAIEKLTISTKLFGEFADSWSLLSELYHKLERVDKAEWAAINTLKSNWIFGMPSRKAIQHFMNLPAIATDEPIIKQKHQLFTINESKDYFLNSEIWLNCINEYEQKADYKSAYLLEQNWGFWISFQSKQLQQSNNFNITTWYKRFIKKYLKYFPNRVLNP